MNKRMATVALVAGVGVGIAHAQSFPSMNAAGVMPVTIPPAGGFVQLGVSLQQLKGAGAIGVVELFGSNQLVRANIVSLATRIHIWDSASQTYVTMHQRLDGRYRLTTGQFTNYPIRTGDALWLQSPSTSVAPHTIYLVGEVLAGPSVLRPMPQGYSMVANPFFAPWFLNGPGMRWVADGARRGVAATADRIYIWEGSGYRSLFLRGANSNWCNVADNSIVTEPIPVGRGFWYLARTNFASRIPSWTGP